jgi:hypothetical protein
MTSASENRHRPESVVLTQNWRAAPRSTTTRGPAETRGNPSGRGGMPDAERRRLAIAAHRALSTHPGSVGELVHREIHAFLDFGYRFDGGALIMRLAQEVTDADVVPRRPTLPRH